MKRPPQQATESEESPAVRTCQQILRVATVLILISFVLIIVSTTVSTGHFVQVFGKLLYYVIVLSAAVSLATWFLRMRFEERNREA